MSRLSNKAKYDAAFKLLLERDGVRVADFLRDKKVPSVLYEGTAGLGGVEEWQVDQIRTFPRFWSRSKPTNVEVRSILEYISNDRALNDTDIYIHIRQGNCSTAITWNHLDSNEQYYTTYERAFEAHKRWLEKYGPREGYFGCAQCGIQIPIDNAVYQEIILYGGKHERRRFCSSTCAMHNQFAQEG